jgi:hypothetical protein
MNLLRLARFNLYLSFGIACVLLALSFMAAQGLVQCLTWKYICRQWDSLWLSGLHLGINLTGVFLAFSLAVMRLASVLFSVYLRALRWKRGVMCTGMGRGFNSLVRVSNFDLDCVDVTGIFLAFALTFRS